MFPRIQNLVYTFAFTGQNLFSEKWTEGDLNSIQPIVNMLSTLSVWVISIVGFGIVIFSILKNALSGLYVINPSFWDRVSQIKKQAVGHISGVVDYAANKNGNEMAQRLGGIVTWLMTLIPDVRALTDFDDGVDPASIDKKQYFMKSLPLLVFQIFIGTFIFLGYPSKVAEWIGEGGTYLVDAIMNNTDPVTVVQRVSDKIQVYHLATDGSPLPYDKRINEFTTNILRAVQSKYPSMEADPTQEVAYVLESWLQTALYSAQDVLSAEQGYTFSCVSTYNKGIPTVASAFQYVSTDAGAPLVKASATNGTVQYMTWISAASLPTGLPAVDPDDYFRITITASPEALKTVSRDSMIVFGAIAKDGTSKSGTNAVTTFNIGTRLTMGTANTDIHGKATPLTVDVVDSSGTTIASINARLEPRSVANTNQQLQLVFDTAEFNNTVGVNNWKSASYVKILLPGTWTLTVDKSQGSNISTTVSVSELRLAMADSPDNTNLTYALTTYKDLSATTTIGRSDAYDAISSTTLGSSSSE